MYRSFYTIFLSPAELWSRVKRLDIVESPQEDRERQHVSDTRFKQLLTQKIFPQLSNLQILFAPQTFATGNYTCSPAIVSFYPAGFVPLEEQWNLESGIYEWVSGSHFWMSARILDLNMDYAQLSEGSIEDGEYILFPQLRKLRISSPHDDSIVDHITQYWKTPILESFSLRDCHTHRWVELLAWSSKTVIALELSAWNAVEESTVVPMPRLRSIIVEHCFDGRWEDIIEAPNLVNLSFGDNGVDYLYHRHRAMFAQHLSRIIGHYPMCTSLSFFSAGNRSVFEFDPTNPRMRAVAMENQWLSS